MTSNDLIDRILEEYRERRIEFVFNAFEKHGYSREWVLDPSNRERINITVSGHPGDLNESHMYSVDDIVLFTVNSSIGFDFEESRVNMSFGVKHSGLPN